MEKMKMESVNMIEHNIALLGQLFPNCITEEIGKDGKPKLAVNMNNLQQMFGMNSTEGNEVYEFTWVGKRAAIVEANKPIRKTLRPLYLFFQRFATSPCTGKRNVVSCKKR